jgi:hypothetical protein
LRCYLAGFQRDEQRKSIQSRRCDLSEADLVQQTFTTLAQTALLPIDARAHDDPAASSLLEAAFAGAVISGQTAYDWTYLALAVGLDCQMGTADEKFFQALQGGAIAKYLGWWLISDGLRCRTSRNNRAYYCVKNRRAAIFAACLIYVCIDR